VPEVSIIVPIYNSEPWLARCLDSLFVQTFPDFEVIAVDDGSTDSSPAILATYAEREPGRLKLLRKQNSGQASARNLGIREARGSWLAFVDSDDWVVPGFVEKLLSKAKDSGADIVDSEVYLTFDAPGGYRFRNTTDTNPKIRALWDSLQPGSLDEEPRWLLVHPAGVWNKIFKASLFDGVSFPTGMNFEDLATTPRLMARATRIAAVREPVYHYYQRKGSTSRLVNESWKHMYQVLRLLKDDFKGRCGQELNFIASARLVTGASVQAIRNGKPDAELHGILDFMDTEFPGWKANPYLKNFLSWKNALILKLMRARAFWLLRLLVDARQTLRGFGRRGV
jgi:glycosyltransferase involved in cell wall biosynthesis